MTHLEKIEGAFVQYLKEPILKVTFAGAGTSAVNQTYTENGYYNGRPFFGSLSSYYLFYNGAGWELHLGPTVDPYSPPILYYTDDDVKLPWRATTWQRDTGANPVPTVTNASEHEWPDSLLNDEGNLRIFPSESDDEKDGQCITVACDMQEEFPEKSGNRHSIMRIELLTPVANPNGLEEHEAAAEVLESLLTDDGIETEVTVAVDEFTCLGILDRVPIEEAVDTHWMTGWTLRVYSCPSDVPPV